MADECKQNLNDTDIINGCPPLDTLVLLENAEQTALMRIRYSVLRQCLGSGALGSDITVNVGEDGRVGGAVNGTVFTAGTLPDAIFRAILRHADAVVYYPAVVTATTNNPTLDNEIGATISPTINATFTKNDAGPEFTREVRLNGSPVASATPYASPSIVIDGDKAFQVAVNHGEGDCKNNNLDEPDCAGVIPLGTKLSNIITYKGYRKLFYGVHGTALTTSAQVRALPSNILNPQAGQSFLITVPIGATRVAIAIPGIMGSVSSIQYVEMGNSDVKPGFSVSSVNVEGAGGYTAISYQVYDFVPDVPFATAATYLVTL